MQVQTSDINSSEFSRQALKSPGRCARETTMTGVTWHDMITNHSPAFSIAAMMLVTSSLSTRPQRCTWRSRTCNCRLMGSVVAGLLWSRTDDLSCSMAATTDRWLQTWVNYHNIWVAKRLLCIKLWQNTTTMLLKLYYMFNQKLVIPNGSFVYKPNCIIVNIIMIVHVVLFMGPHDY